MLEGRGRGQTGKGPKLGNQLPGVERVHEIDVSRTSVQDRQGQGARFHIDPGRFLMGIAAVFQLDFLHGAAAFHMD